MGGDLILTEPRRRTRAVYVLPLLSKDKYGLETKKWHRLPPLSKGGHYHAIYDGGDIVYLFNYKAKRNWEDGEGKVYQLHVKQILDILSTGLEKSNGRHGYSGGYCCPVSPWTTSAGRRYWMDLDMIKDDV